VSTKVSALCFEFRQNSGAGVDAVLVLREIRFHDLRHTAPTLMIDKGVDLVTVSKDSRPQRHEDDDD
jgi:hypothetical protein